MYDSYIHHVVCMMCIVCSTSIGERYLNCPRVRKKLFFICTPSNLLTSVQSFVFHSSLFDTQTIPFKHFHFTFLFCGNFRGQMVTPFFHGVFFAFFHAVPTAAFTNIPHTLRIGVNLRRVRQWKP